MDAPTANIFVWIVLTLGISSLGAALGKRYGVEFPIAIMAALVVTADVLANKLVVFAGFVVPAGVIVASTTFLITDILCEKWDTATSKRAVLIGLFCKVILVVSLWIAQVWPSPGFAQERADLFAQVLGTTTRISLASVVAYCFSQYHDVWAYQFWKKVTNGRHLWLRNNASTMASQLIDSAIFVSIAFYGVMPIGQMILHLWIVKLIIAAMDTPFIYAVRWVTDKTPSSGSSTTPA